MKPPAVTYMTCSRGTPAVVASLKASGSRSNRDTAIRTPAAKAASIPNLFLYRTANNPPPSVEKNVSAPKMIGNMFMHSARFCWRPSRASRLDAPPACAKPLRRRQAFLPVGRGGEESRPCNRIDITRKPLPVGGELHYPLPATITLDSIIV